MSMFDSCPHTNISDGACVDCGLEISGLNMDMTSTYSEYHSHFDSSNIQPFENDLKMLTIPEEIKNLVVKLALSCPKETHRMGVRKQQLFSYIYLAYLQLGNNFDPDSVIEELRMSQREKNMALRIVSGASSADISMPMAEEGEALSAPVVVISPVVYIKDICKENGLSEQIETIIIESKMILSKNKILFEFKPKHIAIALVKHYMNANKINIPKFAKNNGISESILKQHMNRIMV
jgi:hypothetical protein